MRAYRVRTDEGFAPIFSRRLESCRKVTALLNQGPADPSHTTVRTGRTRGYRHGDDADSEEFPGGDFNLFTPQTNEPENCREPSPID